MTSSSSPQLSIVDTLGAIATGIFVSPLSFTPYRIYLSVAAVIPRPSIYGRSDPGDVRSGKAIKLCGDCLLTELLCLIRPGSSETRSLTCLLHLRCFITYARLDCLQ